MVRILVDWRKTQAEVMLASGDNTMNQKLLILSNLKNA